MVHVLYGYLVTCQPKRSGYPVSRGREITNTMSPGIQDFHGGVVMGCGLENRAVGHVERFP